MKKHETEHEAKEKHETEHEAKEKHKTKEKPNTRLWIMAVLLALLIVVSGIQAVELVGLKGKINTEMSDLTISKPKSLATNTAGSSPSGQLQSNLENLPGMVGGC